MHKSHKLSKWWDRNIAIKPVCRRKFGQSNPVGREDPIKYYIEKLRTESTYVCI